MEKVECKSTYLKCGIEVLKGNSGDLLFLDKNVMYLGSFSTKTGRLGIVSLEVLAKAGYTSETYREVEGDIENFCDVIYDGTITRVLRW